MQPRGSTILSQKERHWRHSPTLRAVAVHRRKSRDGQGRVDRAIAGSGGQRVGAEHVVQLGPQPLDGRTR